MQKYVGSYLWQGNPVAITMEKGQLWLDAPVRSKLRFTSSSEFYLTEKEAHFKFITAENGVVDGFVDNDDNRKTERVR